jgi:hypothetical protein
MFVKTPAIIAKLKINCIIYSKKEVMSPTEISPVEQRTDP